MPYTFYSYTVRVNHLLISLKENIWELDCKYKQSMIVQSFNLLSKWLLTKFLKYSYSQENNIWTEFIPFFTH